MPRLRPLRRPVLSVLLVALSLLRPSGAAADAADAPAPASAHAAAIAEAAEHVKLESMRNFNEWGGAYIEVDGVAAVAFYNCPRARWFVVPTNPQRAVLATESYLLGPRDTKQEVKGAMMEQLAAVPEGGFAMIAVHDSIGDGGAVLPEMQAAPAGFGVATGLDTDGAEAPYVALGRKGAAPGEAIERLGTGGQSRHLVNAVFDRRDAVRIPALAADDDGVAGTTGAVRVTLTDERTGEPLSNARVTVQKTRAFRDLRTEPRGQVRLDLDGWSQRCVSITARHPGKATPRINWWDLDAADLAMRDVRLEMPAGVRIGGQVSSRPGGASWERQVSFGFGGLGLYAEGVPRPRVNDYRPFFPDPFGRFVVEDAPAGLVGAEIRFSQHGFNRAATPVTIDEALAAELIAGTAVLGAEEQAAEEAKPDDRGEKRRGVHPDRASGPRPASR